MYQMIIHDRGIELKHFINNARGTTALVLIVSVTIKRVFSIVFIRVWMYDTWSNYPVT